MNFLIIAAFSLAPFLVADEHPSAPSPELIEEAQPIENATITRTVRSGDDGNSDWIDRNAMKNPKYSDRQLAASLVNIADSDVFEFETELYSCKESDNKIKKLQQDLEFSVIGYATSMQQGYPNMENRNKELTKGVIGTYARVPLGKKFTVKGKDINDFYDRLVKRVRNNGGTVGSARLDFNIDAKWTERNKWFFPRDMNIRIYEKTPIYPQNLNAAHPQWAAITGKDGCTYQIKYKNLSRSSALVPNNKAPEGKKNKGKG